MGCYHTIVSLCAALGFKLISQTVVFPVGSVAGESSCFNITFNDDTLMEVSESFSVRAVSSNPNVEFSPGGDMATVTIMDNDGKVMTVIANLCVQEGLKPCMLASLQIS